MGVCQINCVKHNLENHEIALLASQSLHQIHNEELIEEKMPPKEPYMTEEEYQN